MNDQLKSDGSLVQVRRFADNLDSIRIPLNAEERASRPGDVPYWGANSVVDYVDHPLIEERVTLVGEDGAPFFEPLRDVAFAVEGPIWPNNHIHVLRPRKWADHRYLAYALNSVDYSKYIRGSTRDKLNQSALATILIPSWERAKQRAIADYLDHETAEIDTFVEDQQRMRALIEERWTSDLVRRIQTGMAHVSELETTGVPTWPQAPRSWRRTRLKSTVLHHQNGSWGSEPGEDAWTARCIRVADFDKKLARIHSANVTMRDYPVATVHAHGLHPGDLVIEKSGGGPTSPVGNVVLYDGRGGDMYSNFTARIQVADSADSLYAVYLHRSLYLTRVTSRSVKQSTGIQNLDMTSYLNEPVFLPDVDDQRRLAAEIETRRRDLDAVTSDIDSSVIFARERRAALISAAVTGQIDVTQKRRPVAEQLEDEVKQLS